MSVNGITDSQSHCLGKCPLILKHFDFKFSFRLRNPQGGDDWKGAWSDGSEEWKAISDGIKKNIGLEISRKLSVSCFMQAATNHTML